MSNHNLSRPGAQEEHQGEEGQWWWLNNWSWALFLRCGCCRLDSVSTELIIISLDWIHLTSCIIMMWAHPVHTSTTERCSRGWSCLPGATSLFLPLSRPETPATSWSEPSVTLLWALILWSRDEKIVCKIVMFTVCDIIRSFKYPSVQIDAKVRKPCSRFVSCSELSRRSRSSCTGQLSRIWGDHSHSHADSGHQDRDPDLISSSSWVQSLFCCGISRAEVDHHHPRQWSQHQHQSEMIQ